MSDLSVLRILDKEGVNEFKIKDVFPSAFVNVNFPATLEVGSGGALNLYHESCEVFSFPGCVQHASSDILRLRNTAYFLKPNRAAANKEIFLDKDLVRCSKQQLEVKRAVEVIRVGASLSLLGVHCSQWAHFLVEFYPKLFAFDDLWQHIETVVIRADSDDHIVGLVKKAVNGRAKTVAVPPNGYVYFERLFYCSPVAYLCNHAQYTSPSDVVIPTWTRKVVKSNLTTLVSARETATPKRLFIGHDGAQAKSRACTNIGEVTDYFIGRGYGVIFPHRLTLKDKVEIFSAATHLVGPGSSGFTNALFRSGRLDILWFINDERAFDAYISQFCTEYPSHRITAFVGDRASPYNINSSYKVNMQKLAQAVDILGF